MSEKKLYDDNFLKINEWIQSATALVILGSILAVVLFIYVGWIASAVVVLIIIICAPAAYLVLKK